jgi:hypothetical protein
MSVEFECIWKKNESPDRLKAISLWDHFNAFPTKEVTEQRAKEIAYVGKLNGEVVAISTVRPVQAKLFNNNWFYELRVFISPQCPRPGIIIPLALRTKHFFEQQHQQQGDQFIGLISVIQHEKMNRRWRRAHWPVIDFFFAGYDNNGHQIRVSYFKKAMIA